MIICLLLTLFFSIILSLNSEKLSNLFDLKDKKTENSRKIHLVDTSYIGGLIILSTLIIIYFWEIYEGSFKKEILANYLICFAFFLIGFFDDKLNIKPINKIILYSICSYFFININQDLIIDKIYSETFDRYFYTNNLNVFFSILCFLILQNAFNMFDGIDGLLILFSIKILTIINLFNFNIIYLIIILNLLILLFFNFRKKFFLGNNGSSLLSALIALALIDTYKFENFKFSSEKIFLLLIIPGLDMIRLFLTRILNQKNPFEADNEHLHHYLIKKLSHINTTLIITLISLFIFLLSFLIDTYLLIIFATLIYSIVIYISSRSAK